MSAPALPLVRSGSLLDGPVPVADLPERLLGDLAQEIRERLVSSVCRTGGHLGPNLGVVELTIALHRAFSSPRDPLVWDTGHQTYVHKMLTGRADRFATLRQAGGLSGYPSRAESEHDVVENSHASTALAYADGLAKAFALAGRRDRRVVAVVGDGSLTGGMAWEALNNLAAAPERPVVVVLNDNGRSYAPTVGGLARHLAALRAGTATGNLFEDLGLAYLGPVDGHDLDALADAFARARALDRPVVVHCVTRKGAGHPAAETDEADRQHTVSAAPVPRQAGVVVSPRGPEWTSVFADTLLEVGRQRSDIVAVTAAMLLPTGLGPFASAFPERTFDVGIAEQHAVTSAAGLATAGLHPVVAVYSTFVSRAFDQVLMDVAVHRLPVTLVLDRAGITGPDGSSHHGVWDLSLLAPVPGLRLAAPRDARRLHDLLDEAVAWSHGPTVVRFPRGCVPEALPAVRRLGSADVVHEPDPGGRVRHDRPEVLVVAVGPLAGAAVAAAVELDALGLPTTVVDPRWVLPVDPALVEAAGQARLVLTVEDGVLTGGVGDVLARAMRGRPGSPRLVSLGHEGFAPAGERGALLAEAGLSREGIVAAVRTALAE